MTIPSCLGQSIGTSTGFPPWLTDDQIKTFGFFPMVLGMFYCFYGISLVTRNYINPSIDIIKSRNRFSSNTMNATLLAMTNSAAECFIIMNSIFFDVSDIGVYTVVGETAFYSLIIQGMFYLFSDYNTKIDWWIISRETIFLLFYVGLFSGFLYGNSIEAWKAGILLFFYLVHIIMMVLNQYYEVAIKKAESRREKLREKVELCRKDISNYHKNDESTGSRKPKLEDLKNIELIIKDDYIIGEDPNFRDRANSKIMKIYEENKRGRGVIHFRRTACKIILLIQALNLKKKVLRSNKSKVDLRKLIKAYEEEYRHSNTESVNPEEIESMDAMSQHERASAISKARKLKMAESGHLDAMGSKPKEDKKEDEKDSEPVNEAEKEFDEFDDDVMSTEADSKTIYDRINERVNKKVSLKCPTKLRERLMYIFSAPLTYTQYISIPNVMVPGRENFYPLALFMSIVWIYAYTFIIVWWTFELSEAFNINRSIIPLIAYPIGISIRDSKKIVDFLEVKKMFADELTDQEISLAETFSGPIFQITGLVGFTWLIKILSSGGSISFENENIQLQAPLLLVIIVMKYGGILLAKYRTSKKLFAFNSVTYILFTLGALLVDYYDDLAGNK